MLKTKDEFIQIINDIVSRNGVEFLHWMIESVDDERIKKTLMVFLGDAMKEDKDAKTLLISHLAGYMQKQQGKYTY